MRWISFSGELAFLSIGGSAKGIIAIGGTAYGVVAFGGIASAGVIAIGMNAAGSVAAFGMNAIAPICFSLINGAGIYCKAGVNGLGAWTDAGVNATGITAEGEVNSEQSLIPAIGLVAAMLVASVVLSGDRISRPGDGAVPLRHFLSAADHGDAKVRGRLVSANEDTIEIMDGGETVAFTVEPSLVNRARSLMSSSNSSVRIVAEVSRGEETVIEGDEAGYRDRPLETTRVVFRCASFERAPTWSRWLPHTDEELLWIIGWSARLASLASLVALLWLIA